MHNLHSNDLRPNRENNTEENDLINQTRTLIEEWEARREGGTKRSWYIASDVL